MQKARAKRHTQLLVGTAAFAAGLTVGGAYLVKDLEISSEWFLEATPQQVFEILRDTNRYALWWPTFVTRINGAVAPISHNLVVRCALPLALPRLQRLPPLRFTLRFPQVEKDLRIRARITGDIVGIAEWFLIPQPNGVLLKGMIRARLSRPLLNLLVRCVPERRWRPKWEEILQSARQSLQQLIVAGNRRARDSTFAQWPDDHGGSIQQFDI